MFPHDVYDPDPRYPVAGIQRGWDAAVRTLPDNTVVLAVDGPSHTPWAALGIGIGRALADAGRRPALLDVRDHYAEWATVLARTSTEAMARDPDFERLCEAGLEVLFDRLPAPPRGEVAVLVGPGAALVDHDVLWYADTPRRVAEAHCREGRYLALGGRPGDPASSSRRLFFVDWPATDRHRDALAPHLDLWLDLRDADAPCVLPGDDLRAALARLARSPLRTRPWFNSTVWGGHWAKQELGVHRDADNTALGYELIAPESPVVLGSARAEVEVPLQLVAAMRPHDLLGPHVQEQFGSSFPIRFDYLDTDGGGPLSIHCHPQAGYMRDVFGWPYTQHESYYVMRSSPDGVVHLGLREDVDVEAFRAASTRADRDGVAFDVGDFVIQHRADEHQLFLVPAGTPHASGPGNVVLEISATPYLYSLRFYDWLRERERGGQRPVHVDHAFANLDPARQGDVVHEQLVPRPSRVRSGGGWHEDRIGSHEEMFFDVHRIELEAGATAPDRTARRFHVLTVVDGGPVSIEVPGHAAHPLAYAETLVVPAAVGAHHVRAHDHPARVVKAFVR